MNIIIADKLKNMIESHNDENTIVFLKGFGTDYIAPRCQDTFLKRIS